MQIKACTHFLNGLPNLNIIGIYIVVSHLYWNEKTIGVSSLSLKSWNNTSCKHIPHKHLRNSKRNMRMVKHDLKFKGQTALGLPKHKIHIQLFKLLSPFFRKGVTS
ncbi:hypothetical protein V1477_012074 [Vespula maculifrons]|uniref:Uncharacterized protein n=1 Tax=Vespula maculifrons TaxID=7453 RepID=A0ABD2BY11_VESMC